jgi:hypothetical protein
LVLYKILESQSFGFSQEVDEVAEDRQTHQEEEEELEITYIGPFAITLFSGSSNVVRVDVEIQESLQRRLESEEAWSTGDKWIGALIRGLGFRVFVVLGCGRIRGGEIVRKD